jgi:hypothetical protein
MRGDHAFFGTAISAAGRSDRSVRLNSKSSSNYLGDLDFPLVAGVMEEDQDFVGKPASTTSVF